MTPLHWAAYSNRTNVAELLLANKADINAATSDGWTPLSFAAYCGHKDVARFLLINKAKYNLLEVAAVGDLEKVRALLKDHPELVLRRDWALLWATRFGHADVVELLLANKAEVDAKDAAGRTSLHKAASKGHKDVAKLLLAYKADVNAKSSGDKWTALHYAVNCAQRGVAELLLDNKADVNAKDDRGWTPLYVARFYCTNTKEMAELLRQHGGSDFFGDLKIAAKSGDLKTVKVLLQEHPELVFCKEVYSDTTLHLAATEGYTEVAKLLIAAKADVNAKDYGKSTPLHLAAQHGHKAIVELLLANKADVNAKDEYGDTPLHEAAANGHKDVAEVLLANKADVNAGGRGRTPLYLATVGSGHRDVAELLQQHGGHE